MKVPSVDLVVCILRTAATQANNSSMLDMLLCEICSLPGMLARAMFLCYVQAELFFCFASLHFIGHLTLLSDIGFG